MAGGAMLRPSCDSPWGKQNKHCASQVRGGDRRVNAAETHKTAEALRRFSLLSCLLTSSTGHQAATSYASTSPSRKLSTSRPAPRTK